MSVYICSWAHFVMTTDEGKKFCRNPILIACKRNSSHQFGILRIVVFAAVNVKTTRSLDVTPCSLVYGHLCFGNISVFAARLISGLNINAASFSKTSVNICQTTHHHIPEYRV